MKGSICTGSQIPSALLSFPRPFCASLASVSRSLRTAKLWKIGESSRIEFLSTGGSFGFDGHRVDHRQSYATYDTEVSRAVTNGESTILTVDLMYQIIISVPCHIRVHHC